ncbi:hypothetical protein P4O66_011349 [Electrophorus voltai]|uniref:Uncharacterized protein n=1 Tax=Electrophorus voltai TaxID=2609070 RepID=A0AAD8Z8J9_9TELE|nr:hypothetical protein P4O66_011349 [Electrophorus voltai]
MAVCGVFITRGIGPCSLCTPDKSPGQWEKLSPRRNFSGALPGKSAGKALADEASRGSSAVFSSQELTKITKSPSITQDAVVRVAELWVSDLLRADRNYTFSSCYQHSPPVAAVFILAYVLIFVLCMLASFNSNVNPIVYRYFNENLRCGFQATFEAGLCLAEASLWPTIAATVETGRRKGAWKWNECSREGRWANAVGKREFWDGEMQNKLVLEDLK